MLKNTILSAGLVAAAGVLLIASHVNASTVTFSNVNVGDPSYPLSGSIDFTFGSGTVTVTINNTTTSTFSASELLGGVQFTLAGSGYGTPSIETSDAGQPVYVGNEVTIAGSPKKGSTTPVDGSYTVSGSKTNSTLSNPWKASGGGSTFSLTRSGAEDLVIGPPNKATNLYTGDGSINGNGGHNPFISQTATFTLDISGVTTSSSLSPTADVVVYNGTSGDYLDIPPSGAVVTGGPLPVPATLPLVGGGILALGALALRKRGKFQ